jgi:GNAT superfamily N-acetyltransferase
VTSVRARAAGLPAPREVSFRPARESDLGVCAAIWRDALNDYLVRLNLPAIPDELAPIRRLHAHLHATDPERFWVAEAAATPPDAGSEVIAFASAARRDTVWFLSMLFVRPGEQRRGLGRALLERILPDDGATRATGTDSAQPVSNALYASLGIVPRMPLLNLVGRPDRPDAFGALPSGVRAVPFHAIAAGPPGGEGHARLVAAVDALDREVAGFTHPQDHRWLRAEARTGFLYEGPDGTPVGYGYTSEAGRVGPVAVRDEALLAPVLGHLLGAVEPRGAFGLWAPGHAGPAVTALLRAGLRLDGFPVLLCWSRPFADFARYVPISPGLL